jgi:hypothetical protein
MDVSSPSPTSLTELLVGALRAESAARVAGNPALLAAALAHRRHLNLLLGADRRPGAPPTPVSPTRPAR